MNFNGSILVYNTGRSFPFYEEAKPLLYEPDMLFVGLGSQAYRFDENGEGVFDENYENSLKNAKGSFNSQIFLNQLYENFEFLNGTLKALAEYNVFFIVPDEIINEHYKAIKKFVKNKENESRQGIIIKGKCVASKHYLITEQFLEITPNFTGKNVGLEYAQKVFGFGNPDTFTAGDSQNDIDLFKSPVAGVLVGNAEERISNWLNKKPRPLIYKSQLNYANAVIEGLEKFILV